MPTKPRKGVFISYARSDGEEFATILRQRLQAEGIPLWQDREGMEGGRDWWLQITEALDQVEFMALVITPEALKSNIVRKEWRYARQQGVCVYPIKGTPDLDFDTLPRWMRSAHFYDLEREWQKFVNDLKTRCQTPRVPFMVEDLPEGFVPRPGEFDQLLQLLVDERREEPVAITAALRGAGGYGKTTLAKALCHDERIQDAFDDGILWVTLGENPGELTGRIEDLIVTLGDERPGFTVLDAAVNRFKELLADRDILMVIDDVWDRAHLNPFIQGGPRCARLVTTRNLDTLPANAAKVPVDAMQQEEATALLAAGLDEHKLGELNRQLKELASRLGEWPLLLRLVNSALRNCIENDQQSPRDAVTWVNKALDRRGLAYFDSRNSDERHHAVARTIAVSLDLLSVQERKRYGELAIFPEDVEIPLSTLEKLWGHTANFDEFDTEDLCSRLNRFSLLWSYDAQRRLIRLHDVVRKFLIDEQPEKLSSIHAHLLDAHCPVTSISPPWSEMPVDEPYLWDHLAHHLIEARRRDELVSTVKGWRYLVAKTVVSKSLPVEADLLIAERIADEDAPLKTLRSSFANFSHLLNRCEKRGDIEATLFSRLQHLNDLRVLTNDLERHLTRPCLVFFSKLPDLPHPALVRTLSGHLGGVRDCAVSADGATIVSASSDRTLKVWDGGSGAERFTLSGHEGEVRGCAVSADGLTIVSASQDKTLKVWDGNSGMERFTLSGHTEAVNACAVSADGLTIVSASHDKTLKVWDGLKGVERLTLSGHAEAVNDCAVSADGLTIVSASQDKSLKVWDGRNGIERFTLHGHGGEVRGCAVSADGAVIVSTSDNHIMKAWDNGTQTRHFPLAYSDWVCGCAVSADGATIVSAFWDQTLRVWDGRSSIQRSTLKGHTSRVIDCAMSADGAMIVSASWDRTLKVWDGNHELESVRVTGHRDWVVGCAVSADGTTIISASWDNTLKTWDGRKGVERSTLTGHSDWVMGCAVSADGTTVVSASWDRTLKVWDGRTGAERFTLRGHTREVNGCAMSADGTTIVSASWDRTLKVWDTGTGAERFTLRGHAREVRSCAVSADGATILSASGDRTLKLWDGRNGTKRFTLSGHTGAVNDCAVSADGQTIVSASQDGTVKVWDGQTGVERFTLNGHTDAVNGCAVSADGTTIISVSYDGTLKVWDGGTGTCLSTQPVDGPLDDCACSATGKTIVATGRHGVYFLRVLR